PEELLTRYSAATMVRAKPRRSIILPPGTQQPPTPVQEAQREQKERDQQWVNRWRERENVLRGAEGVRPAVDAAIRMCQDVVDLLEQHAGAGSTGALRSCSFM